MWINLTDEMVLEDIQGFRNRIQRAEEKLAVLPGGYLPYPEHKRRKQQRRYLEDDIQHIQTLIGYAKEALSDC